MYALTKIKANEVLKCLLGPQKNVNPLQNPPSIAPDKAIFNAGMRGRYHINIKKFRL
jgi:hypothetical protein